MPPRVAGNSNEVELSWTSEMTTKPSIASTDFIHTHENIGTTNISNHWSITTSWHSTQSASGYNTTSENTITSMLSAIDTTAATTVFSEIRGQQDDFKIVCYFTNWAWYRYVSEK